MRQRAPSDRQTPYDPVRRAVRIENGVCRGNKRKYRGFRVARFYGGIATADCVGCCLGCLFCWSYRQVRRPGRYGRLYGPDEVATRLVALAHRKGLGQVRISGNEPTLCREHLFGVLERIPRDLTFVLETNGILIGHDAGYAEELARFSSVHVRVGLKGTDEDQFARLTGARPEGFGLQIAALANLRRAGVASHAAVMVSFASNHQLDVLRERLGRISPQLVGFEVEEVMLCGDVERRLHRAGLRPHTSHDPP